LAWGPDEEIFIVTNYHVIEDYLADMPERPVDTWDLGEWRVEGSREIRIRNRQDSVRSEILYANKEEDIAVLSRSAVTLEGEPLALADPESVAIGDEVTLFGYGAYKRVYQDWEAILSIDYAIQRKGTITHLGRIDDNCRECSVSVWTEKFHFSAPGIPGDSGGPVVDPLGQVVGLTYAGGAESAIAVHVSHIADAIRQAYLNTIVPD